MKDQVDHKSVKSDAQSVLRQASKAIDRLQDIVGTSGRDAYRTVSDGATDLLRGIDTRRPVRFIRRYPVPVTLAAIGVGFILGTILTRQSTED